MYFLKRKAKKENCMKDQECLEKIFYLCKFVKSNPKTSALHEFWYLFETIDDNFTIYPWLFRNVPYNGILWSQFFW